jgi:hypothetical protein
MTETLATIIQNFHDIDLSVGCTSVFHVLNSVFILARVLSVPRKALNLQSRHSGKYLNIYGWVNDVGPFVHVS